MDIIKDKIKNITLLIILTICFIIVSIFILCVRNESNIKNLGSTYSNIKILDAIFVDNNQKHYLIAGTEITCSKNSMSEILIYDISNDEIINRTQIENSVSICGYDVIDDNVYIGSISANKNSQILCYSFAQNSFDVVANFEEKGIYSITHNDDILYVGTAVPATVYGIDTTTKEKINIVKNNLTEERYIRSLSYNNGYLFGGVGTRAQFIKINVETGIYEDILPQEYKNNSFVYSSKSINNGILFLLSPSCEFVFYDSITNNFSKIVLQEYSQNIDNFDECNFSNFAGIFVVNDGDNFYSIDSYDLNVANSFEKGIVEGVTSSGVYKRYRDGKLIFERDFINDLHCSYAVPVEMCAYDNIVYFPDRRFIIYNTKKNLSKSYILKDEPQASCVNKDGIFTSNYTEATVWFYPFDVLNNNVDLTNKSDFMLYDIEDEQCRPRMMTTSIDDKYLIIGTGPEYGKWGGAVTIFDLKKQKFVATHRNIVKNHTISSVSPSKKDGDIIYLGTYPAGENTYPEILDEPAQVLMYSISRQKIIQSFIPDKECTGIFFIEEMGNNLFVVLGGNKLVKIDMNKGTTTELIDCEILIKELTSYNNKVFCISYDTLYKVDTKNFTLSTIQSGFSELSHLTIDKVTGNIYILDGTELIKIIL